MLQWTLRSLQTLQNPARISSYTRKAFSSMSDKLGVLIEDEDRYVRVFDPSVNKGESQMLQNLKLATSSRLDSSPITRIQLPKPLLVNNIHSDTLYVRPFYDELFKKVRSVCHSLLVGNPGTAKSFFQYYYLARIYNPSLYGPLPPDHLGSTEPPEVIIRQMGESMFVYYIENSIVHSMGKFDSTVFDHFDRSRTLYMFDPGETKTVPVKWVPDVRTFASLSADKRRYEELQKNDTVKKWYMPVWTEEELQCVGRDMRQRMDPQSSLYDFFAPEKISERYKKYGGIFRFVLTTNPSYLDEYVDKDRDVVLSKTDLNFLIRYKDVEIGDVSSYILHYNVAKEGPDAFKNKSMKYASEEVEDYVNRKSDTLPMSTAINQLISIDNGNREFEHLDRSLYERIHLQLQSPGSVILKIRPFLEIPDVLKRTPDVQGSRSSRWISYDVRLPMIERGKMCTYAEMKKGTLYYPGGGELKNTRFPLTDMLFLEENDSLVLVQVSRELDIRSFDLSAMKKLYDELKIPYNVSVKYIYSGHPRRSDRATINFASVLKIDTLPRKEKEPLDQYKERINALKEMQNVLREKWSYFIAAFPDSYVLPVSKKSGSKS